MPCLEEFVLERMGSNGCLLVGIKWPEQLKLQIVPPMATLDRVTVRSGVHVLCGDHRWA